ncbi:MAG: hypothetical protein ACR2HR_07515 [Euzebya sp.]
MTLKIGGLGTSGPQVIDLTVAKGVEITDDMKEAGRRHAAG